MLHYRNGSEVLVGDRVFFDNAPAVVEEVIEGDDLAEWELDEPGFMLLCKKYGRILINPGSADWEDVALTGRADGTPGDATSSGPGAGA